MAALLAGLLIVVLPRRKAFVPFLAAALLISTDQVLVLGGVHFPMLRVLIVFGAVRILRSKPRSTTEIFSGGINAIDIALLLFAGFTALDGILLWQERAAVIYQIGNLYSTLGAYILLRFLIRDHEDVKLAIRTLAYVAMVAAAIMICEHLTGRNPYYATFGGAMSDVYSSVSLREDHIRATGFFAHPILAGTFGGIIFPLFVGLWWNSRRDRKLALIGAVSAATMGFAASSSTALFGMAGGILGLFMWPLRRHMRIIRWSIAIVIVSLHLVMKAPVWHLISRVDLSGGSSSYHRYQLVNECILHFKDWFLIGTKQYASWGWDMWDLSNQYVGTADTVGIIPLLSFIGIIVFGFRYLGKARKAASKDRKQELFVWAVGASLFANVVAFWGIGYFDQTVVAWYAIVAMISAASFHVSQSSRMVPESRIVASPIDEGQQYTYEGVQMNDKCHDRA